MGGGFLYAIIILSVQPLLKHTELITWIYYFSPYTRVLDFLIGVSAALLYKRYPLKIKSKLLMTILEALSLLLVIVCIIYESQIHYIFIVGIIFALCFYIFGQEKGYLSEYFALSIFRKLAKYSYSFYLIHYLVIMSMVKTLNLQNGLTGFNILMSIVMFVISALLSYILQEFTHKLKLPFTIQQSKA